jgi:ribonucleoside-diphosphate reductase alpha chain
MKEKEIKTKSTSTRRLGLGITGLHDALLKMGIKYSSEEGREVAAKIVAGSARSIGIETEL